MTLVSSYLPDYTKNPWKGNMEDEESSSPKKEENQVPQEEKVEDEKRRISSLNK